MRVRGELCESAKQGRCCIDDICLGSDVTLCGFDKEFYESEIRREQRDSDFDDDEPDDDFDDEDNFDCGMTPDGQCMKAGSEECDWECPVMARIIRKENAKEKHPK